MEGPAARSGQVRFQRSRRYPRLCVCPRSEGARPQSLLASGDPDWFGGTVTKENARQILTEHIRTVAGRYARRLHSWDVVNEAIDAKSDRPDGLRKSPWFDLIGPDYIDIAFRTAREADSKALLTYNDY